MAEGKPEQEPSIEEILASIRQIISDDEEQPAADAPDEGDSDAQEEDVLELTQEMKEDEEPAEIEIEMQDSKPEEDTDLDEDFDIALAELNETLAAQEPQIEETEDEMVTPPQPPADAGDDNIMSDKTRAAATASMARLASGMPISKPEQTEHHYDGVTLEDIVRDLLGPMLRDWMDSNLPPTVERLVQKELEKMARKAMDS